MPRPQIILVIYLVLLLIGIPWYWPADSTLIVMGIPAWVFVAIISSLITSIFTAYLLIRFPWSSEIKPDDG